MPDPDAPNAALNSISTNGNTVNSKASPANPSNETTVPKISGAELKKRAKAEKAARRAKEKEAPGGPSSSNTASAAPPQAIETSARRASTSESSHARKKSGGPELIKPKQTPSKAPPQGQKPHQRQASVSAGPEAKHLPTRRRPSQAVPSDITEEVKQIPFFSHLYSAQPRAHTIPPASKDVHPAILALALHLQSYTICGSTARCAATLLALKSVIQSYTTPPSQALSRHLTSHHLPPQLTHLKTHGRPFAVAQSNAIRALKEAIIKIDPSVPEATAKAHLCTTIDTYIRDRLTVADRVIAEATAARIATDDVILVYAKSSVVLQALLLAAGPQRKRFRVVVADSRPLFEGRRMAESLAALPGIEVTYVLLTGLAHAVRGVSKCVLGAHAVLADGGVYSRAGTALVAMLARDEGAPVLVCAESVKLTERVAVGSVIGNELGLEGELVSGDGEGLKGWRHIENLCLLNALYDVTPAALVDVVITELGSVPPTSAAVVQRMSTSG